MDIDKVQIQLAKYFKQHIIVYNSTSSLTLIKVCYFILLKPMCCLISLLTPQRTIKKYSNRFDKSSTITRARWNRAVSAVQIIGNFPRFSGSRDSSYCCIVWILHAYKTFFLDLVEVYRSFLWTVESFDMR